MRVLVENIPQWFKTPYDTQHNLERSYIQSLLSVIGPTASSPLGQHYWVSTEKRILVERKVFGVLIKAY
jgi:hypothetical protein